MIEWDRDGLFSDDESLRFNDPISRAPRIKQVLVAAFGPLKAAKWTEKPHVACGWLLLKREDEIKKKISGKLVKLDVDAMRQHPLFSDYNDHALKALHHRLIRAPRQDSGCEHLPLAVHGDKLSWQFPAELSIKLTSSFRDGLLKQIAGEPASPAASLVSAALLEELPAPSSRTSSLQPPEYYDPAGKTPLPIARNLDLAARVCPANHQVVMDIAATTGKCLAQLYEMLTWHAGSGGVVFNTLIRVLVHKLAFPIGDLDDIGDLFERTRAQAIIRKYGAEARPPMHGHAIAYAAAQTGTPDRPIFGRMEYQCAYVGPRRPLGAEPPHMGTYQGYWKQRTAGALPVLDAFERHFAELWAQSALILVLPRKARP